MRPHPKLKRLLSSTLPTSNPMMKAKQRWGKNSNKQGDTYIHGLVSGFFSDVANYVGKANRFSKK